MSYSTSYNPDVVPSTPIRRAAIYGAKCPISGVEFLNLIDVDGREQVDESITMDSLVAEQKLHTWGIIRAQDETTGPRSLSIADRKALYIASQE